MCLKVDKKMTRMNYASTNHQIDPTASLQTPSSLQPPPPPPFASEQFWSLGDENSSEKQVISTATIITNTTNTRTMGASCSNIIYRSQSIILEYRAKPTANACYHSDAWC
mmetsp:Transcript_23929/g.36607  ORF Transcript_23929/g.36607 Transcript_23929/m.36607 type:complete len:110 (-) Transcript_23929:371-700(-)